MSDHDFKPKGTLWLFIILVLVCFAWAVSYFGGKNPELLSNGQPSPSSLVTARQPRTYTVFYSFGVFSPTNLRIHAGDSVRFQNDGSVPIHIVSDSTNNVPNLAGFDSVGEIPPQSVFIFTFSQVGTFGYHNAKNQVEEGTVIVRE